TIHRADQFNLLFISGIATARQVPRQLATLSNWKHKRVSKEAIQMAVSVPKRVANCFGGGGGRQYQSEANIWKRFHVSILNEKWQIKNCKYCHIWRRDAGNMARGKQA